MHLFNSQHGLSNYCSGITEAWSGTVWWEQKYLMPVLLTNILDCEIMALGSFLSAPSTKLLVPGGSYCTLHKQFLTSTLLQT